MNAIRIAGRCAAGAVLAGLMVVALPAPLPAAEAAAPEHLGLLPPDCTGFVTVRLARVLTKLHVPSEGREPSWHVSLAQAGRELGLPLTGVDRLSYVFLPGGKEPVAVFEGTRPFRQKAVLEAFLNGWKSVKHREKTLYVTCDSDGLAPDGKRDRVLHFVSSRLFLVGGEAGVKKLLHPAADGPAIAPTFTAAQRQAEDSDVVAWGGAGAFTAAASVLPDVQSGTMTLGLGERVTVQVSCRCASKEATRKIEKVARLYCDMFAGQILTLCACRELEHLCPGIMGGQKELRSVPLKLFRGVEDGLRHARIETARGTTSLTISIPVDAETLYAEIGAATHSPDGTSDLGKILWPLPFLPRTHVGKAVKRPQDLHPESEGSPASERGMAPLPQQPTPKKDKQLPSARYLEHPPQYFPPSPPFPEK